MLSTTWLWRALAILAAGLPLVLASGRGSRPAPIPPIDERAPAEFATATFALG